MIYTILNKMFGWDYIAWANTADCGIARVFNTPDGRAVYFRYRVTKVIDEIHSADQVIWLTCKPSKYLREDKP